MKKKKQNKQQSNKYRKFLLPTFIIMTIFSIIVLFASAFFLIQENIRQNEYQSKNDLAYFVSRSIDGLVQDAPIASYSNQQFIDSAKLKFTKTENTSLVYQYSPPGSYGPADDTYNQTEYIFLSSRILLNSALNGLSNTYSTIESFNKVPGAQNCSRLFAITFEDKVPDGYPEYSKISDKLLTDGRTAYIWKASGELCPGAVESMGDDILNVINTIQSY